MKGQSLLYGICQESAPVRPGGAGLPHRRKLPDLAFPFSLEKKRLRRRAEPAFCCWPAVFMRPSAPPGSQSNNPDRQEGHPAVSCLLAMANARLRVKPQPGLPQACQEDVRGGSSRTGSLRAADSYAARATRAER